MEYRYIRERIGKVYFETPVEEDDRGPLVQLSGVNLQILNGEGSTRTVNGLGNLIIGYDEVTTGSLSPLMRCSNGLYTEQDSCVNNGGVWSHTHKSGSHYLVTGTENNYSSFGGVIAGYNNFSTREFATVTGGSRNTASGILSNVNGGIGNYASGASSSISGGYNNNAIGFRSSVSGGGANTASAPYSSVNGGYKNTAGGIQSSVSGGRNNTALGDYSSVNWGYKNTAGGIQSSVSGKYLRSVNGQFNWMAGDLFEDQ